VERDPAPWRALEATTAPEDAVPARPSGGFSPDLAGVSVPLVVAGAMIVMVGLAIVAILLMGAGGPRVDVPASVGGGSIDVGGSSIAAADGSAEAEVVVEVAGAVTRPGVFHLAAGQRVADAITAAGGYGPRVDAGRATARLNLAARLADGDRILVPSRDDPIDEATAAANPGSAGGGSAGSGSAGVAPGTPLDLNHASATELDALPGIGPVTAAKIIAARTEQPFSAVDDLRTRKLLGQAAFEKLRDLVTVR
jgi:competence protein ComEA